jgi:hypothetical protein
LGKGLAEEPGSVKVGDVVSPEALHRMLVQLADPLTGTRSGGPRRSAGGHRSLGTI